MQELKDIQLGGERPLFESHHLLLDNVTITDGESAIKECSDIIVKNCHFIGKYPTLILLLGHALHCGILIT